MLNLKMQRLARGWSQAELARRSQVNSNTISQIESERFRPYPVQLAKLARALGIPEWAASRLLEKDGDEDARGPDSSSGGGDRCVALFSTSQPP